MKQPLPTLGERIEFLRIYWGLTNLEMGSAIGVNNSTIGKIIKNEVGLKQETLLAFFAKGVNLNWLLTGQGEPFIKKETGPGEEPVDKDIQISFKQSEILALKSSLDKLMQAAGSPLHPDTTRIHPAPTERLPLGKRKNATSKEGNENQKGNQRS